MFLFQLEVKNIIYHFVFVVFANQFKARCIKFSHSLQFYVLKPQMLFVSTYSLYMMCCTNVYNG